jgi:hypothetical protein
MLNYNMGEKIKKYSKFRKSPSFIHYIFWVAIFLIFIVIITFLQTKNSNYYARIILIGALIFYFLFGHYFAISSLDSVKNLYTKIINLNNFNYGDLIIKRKIPVLLFVLPVYLVIFLTFFIIAGYNSIEALIFGWLVLIFVRSSHYVDKELGAKFGEIVGAFFIPFGFIIILIKGASFYRDVSTGMEITMDHIGFILYFIVFLLATIPLEVLMEYRGKNKRIEEEEKRKKKEWNKDSSFVRYKEK